MSLKREKIKFATIFGMIAFSTMFVVTGVFMNLVYGAPDFEKHYLVETDAYLNRLVDKCTKETDFNEKVYCTNLIEDAWWFDCSMDYDKLDTCKNGKIENFLKEKGINTK